MPVALTQKNMPVLIDVIINEKLNDPGCHRQRISRRRFIPSRIENVVLDNVIVNNVCHYRLLYKEFIEPIVDNYDFIFIDCPPTMGQAVTAASLICRYNLRTTKSRQIQRKGIKNSKSEKLKI